MAALTQSGISFEDHDIEEVIQSLDTHNNNQISYSEFLAATIDINELMTEKKLQSIFQSFDCDGCGHISKQDIIVAFSKKGRDLTE